MAASVDTLVLIGAMMMLFAPRYFAIIFSRRLHSNHRIRRKIEPFNVLPSKDELLLLLDVAIQKRLNSWRISDP